MFKNESSNVVDKNVCISGKYPSIDTPYIYINDVILKSPYSVDRHLLRARQDSKSMLDYLLDIRKAHIAIKQAKTDIEEQEME